MKVTNDPKKLLVEMRNKAIASPDIITGFSANRLKKLNSAFYRDFNPDHFCANMLAQTDAIVNGKSSDIPLISGIPITDFMVYGLNRLNEIPITQGALLRKQLLSRMLELNNVADLAVLPLSIGVTNKGDGTNAKYVPTFAELTLNSLADQMLTEKRLPTQPMVNLVNQLDSIDTEYGKNSIPLAIIGLKLSHGFRQDLNCFTTPAIASGVQYLLENMINQLPESITIALIDSAVDSNLALDSIKIRNTLPMHTFLKNINNELLLDKFEGTKQRQVALASIKMESHRISHDYDPTAYFDI